MEFEIFRISKSVSQSKNFKIPLPHVNAKCFTWHIKQTCSLWYKKLKPAEFIIFWYH
jgi:hypothetical protein